jgi:hypothetical protein
MTRLLLSALVLLLSWVPAGLAEPSLDLTPIPKEIRVDGAIRRLVCFRSNEAGSERLSLVEYAAPWPMTGDRASAVMSIPGMNASASIKSVEPGEPLDVENDVAVREWVTKTAPVDATGFNIEQILRDPVRLNEHGTVEVIMSYSLFGRPLQVSAFLCRRRGDGQTEFFLFQLAATPVHFKEVHKTFRASLYSIVGF